MQTINEIKSNVNVDLSDFEKPQAEYLIAEAYQKQKKEEVEIAFDDLNYYEKLENAKKENEQDMIIRQGVEIEDKIGLLEANSLKHEKEKELLNWYIEKIKNLNELPDETFETLKSNMYIKPSITKKLKNLALNHKFN